MSGGIHIGTSGWSYKHWKEIFYPKGLAASKWLEFYTHQFSTTEINGSFYRLPSEETVEKWTDTVPRDFIFCPKMSRFLTHMKKLREPEEPLHRFFTVMAPMKKKMGPVLLQLPPRLPFDMDVTTHLYRQMKKYRAHSFVMEVRHESWLKPESIRLMEEYQVGFVMAQSGHFFPYAEHVTAKDVYVRFHGPAELYASQYSDEQLRSYARKFRKWSREGHEVWAFFNNDIHGYAFADARRLAGMI